MKNVKSKREPEPLISKVVQYHLAAFFAHHPPKEFNRQLRNVIIDYLGTHPDGDQFDFDSALDAIWSLMKVIDRAEDELVPRTFTEIFEIARKGNYIPEHEEHEVDYKEADKEAR